MASPQGTVDTRLKAAYDDADGIADPLARQFLAGERCLGGYVGIFVSELGSSLSVVAGLVDCVFGQFCFDGRAVFVRDAIEAIDFSVDLAFDLGQPRCRAVTSSVPVTQAGGAIKS